MDIIYRKCRACCNPIRLKAKKCEYCGTDQNKWRNRCIVYAPISSSFIALLALAVTLAPSFIDKYLSKSAQVHLEILDAQKGVLEIFANNKGNKGAVLGDIKLSYGVVNRDYCREVDLKLNVLSRIVRSNDEIILTTKVNPQLPTMSSRKPLTDEERTEYEKYNSSDNNGTYSLSPHKQLEYAERSNITVCNLTFSGKSSDIDIYPDHISYNCIMPKEQPINTDNWY